MYTCPLCFRKTAPAGGMILAAYLIVFSFSNTKHIGVVALVQNVTLL
jgi:hypothetical protein